MVFQLTYRSKAIDGIMENDIQSILQESQTFNEKHQISGCLVYHQHRFVQILEGDEKVVLDLYKKIEKDERHRKVLLLSTHTAKKRMFESWGMIYHSVDETTSDIELELFKQNLLTLEASSSGTTETELEFWRAVKMQLIKKGQFTI